LPAPGDFQLWETCQTINDTWAYNKNDRNFKSVKELIQELAEVASKGGNFLLDVGPTPEGTIQPEFVERLQAIGKWMKVNGDSIYGTTYGPLQGLQFGKTTAKDKTIYLHVFDWPSKPELVLPELAAHVTGITVLATGQKVHFQQARGGITIAVPAQAPDPNDSVFEINTR
jgi:alpha-L-fucosidase